jgi:hypothetical protein
VAAEAVAPPNASAPRTPARPARTIFRMVVMGFSVFGCVRSGQGTLGSVVEFVRRAPGVLLLGGSCLCEAHAAPGSPLGQR